MSVKKPRKLKIIPVILAGGKGERFWPLSRITHPKQTLPLISSKPMIVETYQRLQEFPDFYIVANPELCKNLRTLLPVTVNFIEEPEARNTAPAIGLACAVLMQKYGDCIAFFETADHFYADPQLYLQEVHKACNFAMNHDKIVLIGIRPTDPHMGYGYIQYGNDITSDIKEILSFREKPNLETAQQYLIDGNYLWNSGMFFAKCSVLLAEINRHLPQLASALHYMRENSMNQDSIIQEFNKAEKISIDYGILEKSSEIVVLKSFMPWIDIGDLNSLAGISLPLQDGPNWANTFLFTENSIENLIHASKLVALIGVDHLIVIDTPDALLICNRNQTQNIRKIVDRLPEKNR